MKGRDRPVRLPLKYLKKLVDLPINKRALYP
jgi:hypothetical protein